jgi:AraC-like DNA-binding protein/tetratricopeptide (TPR) repeat protein
MMNKKCFLYCITTVFGFIDFMFSQSNITSMKDSVYKNMFINPRETKIIAHKLLNTCKENKLVKDESNAYYFLAEICGTISQKDSAFYYFDKAIEKATQINDNRLLLYHKINKANYLFSEYDFDGALTLYDECLRLAKRNNDNMSYDYIMQRKGNINYEIGKYKEALETFKEGKKNKNFDKNTNLLNQLSIAKAYLKLNEPDSSFIYIKQGIIDSKRNNLTEFEIHFLNQQGLTLIYKNQYPQAKKSFDSALFLSQKNGFIEMSRLILINMSKMYTLQKEHLKSINILKLIIENKENVVISSENTAEMDYLLAENYKGLNNLALSNFHFQKYIKEEKKLGQKKIETIDHLHKIDVAAIEDQKAEQTMQKWILFIILMIFITGVIVLYYKRRKKNIENQIKFDTLLQKISNYEIELSKNQFLEPTLNSINQDITESFYEVLLDHDNDFIDDVAQEIDESTNFIEDPMIESEIVGNSFVIKDEKVTEILEKLIKLEEKKYYLKQEYTLHNVAKRLKTNTAYLSKIVNSELGKTFSTYTNELRINYIIIELKNNAKLRSYSINAISEEIGYKSSESFVKYFKLATGISPTIYIKKINKLHEN